VLVIGPNGEQLGKMTSSAANELALHYSLDLYCVAPQAIPPVCKILNYGKLRFEQQKQDRLARKNHKASETKEIQLTPVIGEHDLETKARKAHEFLEDGNKVQVSVVFRGRQMSHKEVGEEVMKKFLSLETDVSIIEKTPYWEDKWYNAILGPKQK
jgi:translation initiation factor IF-3